VKVAYLVSRFPKLSETFIVDEILALERRGVGIELFSLVRQRERVVHPEAHELARRCHVAAPLSPWLWLAQLAWLTRAQQEFRQALESSPEDWDAKFNYELAGRLAAQLRTAPKREPSTILKLLRPQKESRPDARRIG